jgi:GNAT superfamily N-acetyltransferase
MATVSIASTHQHLEQILKLQQNYLAPELTSDEQRDEGFVFVEYEFSLLKRMADKLPQAITLADNQVVGYCLSLPLTLQSELPILKPMFNQFNCCSYKDVSLNDYNFFVGGQTCVDRQYRGQGLMARMYNHIQNSLTSDYDLCVTEIATRNLPSVRAHEKMGFEVISKYSDEKEEWVIVAWNLKETSQENSKAKPSN